MPQKPTIKLHHLCRACNGPLAEILDLGEQRLNDFPASAEACERVIKVPLRLAVCTSCTLVQLTHTTPPDWLYRTYWYRSAVNEMMRKELHDIADQAVLRSGREPGLARVSVLDIGANDGTLLNYFPSAWQLTGIDPATNLQEDLARVATRAIHDYFPSQELEVGEQFDIITAIACCYDLENPTGFFLRLAHHLRPWGLACLQFQDLAQQIECRAFDNVCHEHLEYYTLHSLQMLLRAADLEAVDCETRAINGGSLRVWVRHRGAHSYQLVSHQRNLLHQLDKERLMGLTATGDLAPFRRFRRDIDESIRQIHALVETAQVERKTIDLYGASTKGNILLQVMGLGPREIRQAIDRSPAKHGHYTITGIPIVSEAGAQERPADMWLTPIWQFKPSVLEREAWYLHQGGLIVFPLPRVEVVQATGVLA